MADVTLEQIQQIVNTLKGTIEGAADLARRIEVLEAAHAEVQTSMMKFFETYQAHAQAQIKLHTDMAQSIGRLEARIEELEGRGGLVM